MNENHQQNLYHVNANVALMVKNIIQIKCEKTIKVDMSAKIIGAKNVYLET